MARALATRAKRAARALATRAKRAARVVSMLRHLFSAKQQREISAC